MNSSKHRSSISSIFIDLTISCGVQLSLVGLDTKIRETSVHTRVVRKHLCIRCNIASIFQAAVKTKSLTPDVIIPKVGLIQINRIATNVEIRGFRPPLTSGLSCTVYFVAYQDELTPATAPLIRRANCISFGIMVTRFA